ncbi:MAG: hypothetical protein JWN44_4523 [Myxococcales bacterium]|nr:hypothetical protein [Myxococcales bacterium]
MSARPSRRQFLKAAAALSGSLLVADSIFEARSLEVRHLTLDAPSLPPALDGLRIAHLTDLHLPCAAADRAAEAIEAEGVDLVVVTGDTIQRRPRRLELVTPFMLRARGRRGTFAVRGNNDHWSRVGEPSLAQAYADAGATLLDNSSAVVHYNGADLQIIGLDDPSVGTPDLARALKDADRTLPSIWLVHSPGYIDRIDPVAWHLPRAIAIFAGHTHGGQIRGPGCTPYTPPGSGRFKSGWYEAPLGPAYISRGVGTSVIPFRFLCQPELPIFTLRRRTAT